MTLILKDIEVESFDDPTIATRIFNLIQAERNKVEPLLPGYRCNVDVVVTEKCCPLGPGTWSRAFNVPCLATVEVIQLIYDFADTLLTSSISRSTGEVIDMTPFLVQYQQLLQESANVTQN